MVREAEVPGLSWCQAVMRSYMSGAPSRFFVCWWYTVYMALTRKNALRVGTWAEVGPGMVRILEAGRDQRF